MSRVPLSRLGRWALAALGVYLTLLFLLILIRFFLLL